MQRSLYGRGNTCWRFCQGRLHGTLQQWIGGRGDTLNIPCLHPNCTPLLCKGGGQHGQPEVSPQPVTGLQAPRSAQFPGVRLPPLALPPPCTEGSPRSGRTLAAANESSRRLREPGRLCPPGIGHAMGSGGRGLGAPRAWLGQACCWVTGRRVSPGNGGGYRSLAGRDGGRAQAGRPRRPQQQRGLRPASSCNLHTRAARTLRTLGRPAAAP